MRKKLKTKISPIKVHGDLLVPLYYFWHFKQSNHFLWFAGNEGFTLVTRKLRSNKKFRSLPVSESSSEVRKLVADVVSKEQTAKYVIRFWNNLIE